MQWRKEQGLPFEVDTRVLRKKKGRGRRGRVVSQLSTGRTWPTVRKAAADMGLWPEKIRWLISTSDDWKDGSL